MQFQVPQFIDVEDKVFGPFTVKQFVYMVGGAGLSFIAYRIVGSFSVAMIFIAPILGLSFALAFVKIHNREFIEVIQSFVIFTFTNKMYLWKKMPNKTPSTSLASDGTKTEQEQPEQTQLIQKGENTPTSNLGELAWGLDVLDLEEEEKE